MAPPRPAGTGTPRAGRTSAAPPSLSVRSPLLSPRRGRCPHSRAGPSRRGCRSVDGLGAGDSPLPRGRAARLGSRLPPTGKRGCPAPASAPRPPWDPARPVREGLRNEEARRAYFRPDVSGERAAAARPRLLPPPARTCPRPGRVRGDAACGRRPLLQGAGTTRSAERACHLWPGARRRFPFRGLRRVTVTQVLPHRRLVPGPGRRRALGPGCGETLKASAWDSPSTELDFETNEKAYYPTTIFLKPRAPKASYCPETRRLHSSASLDAQIQAHESCLSSSHPHHDLLNTISRSVYLQGPLPPASLFSPALK